MANVEITASNITAPAKPRSKYYAHAPKKRTPTVRKLESVFSRPARRGGFRTLYLNMARDLGGLGYLSEGQRQLLRRAACLSAECERMEALSASGEQPLNIDQYGAASERIGRILTRLAIAAKTMRDVGHKPEDLRSYLAAVEHDPADRDGSP